MVANDNFVVREFTEDEKMAASSLVSDCPNWNIDPHRQLIFTHVRGAKVPLIMKDLDALGIAYGYDSRDHVFTIDREADQQTIRSIEGMIFGESHLPEPSPGKRPPIVR